MADVMRCPGCKGAGLVPLSAPLATTLDFLRGNGPATVIEVYRALKLSPRTVNAVNNRLEDLRALGFVDRRHKIGKQWVYEATERPPALPRDCTGCGEPCDDDGYCDPCATRAVAERQELELGIRRKYSARLRQAREERDEACAVADLGRRLRNQLVALPPYAVTDALREQVAEFDRRHDALCHRRAPLAEPFDADEIALAGSEGA